MRDVDDFERDRARVAIMVVAGALAGCASIDTRTEHVEGRSMTIREVSITREAILPAERARAFDFIAADDVLPKILTGYGPLPAIVGTSEQTGPWSTPGSARVNHVADGSTLREQVTAYARPAIFEYRIWDFGHPMLRALASEARGAWQFTERDGATYVRWTYTWQARSALTALPLSMFTAVLWRGYMDRCLENSARLLAGEAPGASLAKPAVLGE